VINNVEIMDKVHVRFFTALFLLPWSFKYNINIILFLQIRMRQFVICALLMVLAVAYVQSGKLLNT
jgi:hypothetical protein